MCCVESTKKRAHPWGRLCPSTVDQTQTTAATCLAHRVICTSGKSTLPNYTYPDVTDFNYMLVVITTSASHLKGKYCSSSTHSATVFVL